MINASKLTFCLCALLWVAARSLSAQEPPAAPVAPASGDEFSELIAHLDKFGLRIDPIEGRKAAMEALIKTADPLGRFLSTSEAEQLRLSQAGRFFSPGLRLGMTNGTPWITEIQEGSPAQSAALAVGDRLVRINDDDTTRTDLAAVCARLRGLSSETIRIQVVKANASTTDVTVTTRLMSLPPVEIAEALPSGLCYLKINGLYKDSAVPIADALKAWRDEQRSGIILDLRGADGADLDAAAEISNLLGPSGSVIFTLRDQQDQDIAVYKLPAGLPLGMPTMVLVDEHTTGAAEALAASLKRSIRGAMLLGVPTPGDPGVREMVKLPSDRLAYIATRRLITEDGTVYDGRQGVVPDVRVSARVSDFVDYEPELTSRKRALLQEELEDQQLRIRVKGDPALRRAVDVLLGLKALDIRGFPHSDTISN